MSEPTLPQGELRDRRSFLKIAGIGGVVLVAAGCDSDTPDPIDPGDFGVITGTVRNEDGNVPLGQVTISFEGEPVRTVQTAEDGSFTIADFPVGTYTLVASTNGFFTEMTQVTVTDGGTETVDFVLRPGGPLELDFSDRFGVLNYAYALEQLEAAFYTQVVDTPFAGIDDEEMRILTDLRDHEIAHREFFAAKIPEQGGMPIRGLVPNFEAVTFEDRTSVLETARTFEDLGVAAYNGAASLINQEATLVNAGEIVSVEARHAAAIRDLLDPLSFAPDAFDAAMSPSAVIAAVAPFVQNEVTLEGL